jgi:CheY-like chemotaxis protein
VESEPGVGSRFWFSLPLRRGQPSAMAAAGAATVPDLAGRRVLIIDDHELDQRIFRVQLTRLGATVTVAASGAAGLEKIKQAMTEGIPFDLAIVDHHMPEMDGFEFGTRLAADPALSALPRIMVSSGHLRGDADRASGIGYGKFLAKPVHRRRLFETLNEVMPQGRASAPCAPVQPTEAAAVSTAPLSPASAHRILIAEDNEVNQLLILAFLKAGGYQADVAVNGREAVDAVRARPYALVLMDINMPIMGGVVATQAIRGLQAPAKDVPIIAVTASNMAGDREHFLAVGMDDFLPKPIRRDSLLRMVEKWWPRSDEGQRQATA